MTAKRVPTEIDGVEVIAHEQGVGPHPMPKLNGRIVPFNGVTKVLLADGTDRHVCDDCGYVGSSTRVVVSHRNATHNLTKPRGSAYADDVLRRIMRIARQFQAEHAKDWAAKTAEALNEAKVPTARGGSWTAGAVATLYRAYAEKYRTRRRTVNTFTPTSGDSAADLQIVREWIRFMPNVEAAVMRLVHRLEAVEETVVDPEVVDKARRWDAMQELMRGRG